MGCILKLGMLGFRFGQDSYRYRVWGCVGVAGLRRDWSWYEAKLENLYNKKW